MNTENQPAIPRRLRSAPGGFSLLELMLVMGILVLVGALSIPAVYRSFSRQALDKSANRVRVAMGQARVRAIRTGEIHAVFFIEGGSWFNVAPFSKSQEQAGISANRQRLADNRQQSNLEDDLLPMGITFAAGVVATDARAAEAMSANGGESRSLRPILFYPDGTSQDARIVLQSDKGNFAEIQLRGLTGLSSVIRLKEDPSVQ